MKVLGIDIGGTRIKYGIIHNQTVLITEFKKNPSSASSLMSLLCHIVKEYDDIDITGIGVPGMVDEEGTVHLPPNLPYLNGLNLKSEIERYTGKRVIVENDANLIALGEWAYGAGLKELNTIVITLGTGIGTGIITEGTLLKGHNGWGGEGGHMMINPKGPQCNCGNRGCLESIIGSVHFISRAKKILKTEQLDAEKLNELAQEGQPSAVKLWEEYGYWLGIGITNLVHIFSPSRIVLTGGLANAYESFKNSMFKTIENNIIGYSERRIEVVLGALAEQASLYGVLYLAKVL